MCACVSVSPRPPWLLPLSLSAENPSPLSVEVRLCFVPGASSAPRPKRWGARVCIRNFMLEPSVTAARDGWVCTLAVAGAASWALIVHGVDE